jgi:hypothetical protein
MITVVGGWTATRVALPSPVGSRFEVGGRNVSTLMLRTGRPAQLDAYVGVTGSIENTGAHDRGFRPSVGVRPAGIHRELFARVSGLPRTTTVVPSGGRSSQKVRPELFPRSVMRFRR